MANPDHLAILMEAVDKDDISIWNNWRYENSEILPDLTNSNLRRLDLSEAELGQADLSNADLSGATLIDTDFSNAELPLADFSGSNLKWAKLTHVNLNSADLSLADLTGANLRGANLRWTHINSVNVSQADFYYTTCGATTFGNIDLSTVKGLDTIVHLAPSTIGIDTLYKSGGKIPEVFLRGCGVPENMITYAKSLVTNPIDYYSCFISYSHADKSFARRVHDTLQARGIRCWLDEHQMLPGDDIYEEIDRGIRYWDKVLLCCSENSLTSWWVDNEINKAFKKEREIMREQGHKVRTVIPLDLDGFLRSDKYQSGKKDELQSRLSADFTNRNESDTAFDQAIEQVIKALQTSGAKEDPPTPKL